MVRMEHIRAVGYRVRTDGKTFCASGIRDWCASQGIDYLELVRNGIPVEKFAGVDSWGDMIAEEAKGACDGRQ